MYCSKYIFVKSNGNQAIPLRSRKRSIFLVDKYTYNNIRSTLLKVAYKLKKTIERNNANILRNLNLTSTYNLRAKITTHRQEKLFLLEAVKMRCEVVCDYDSSCSYGLQVR